MKNIWIINHHALTPSMSGGTRHYDFAKELVSRGYKVTIIAASFHYSKLKEMKEYQKSQNYLKENIDSIDFIWFKTPPYIGNGFGRVKNMLSFSYQVINTIPKLNLEKPDTILGSSVHLFAVYAAYKLSQKYNAKFIMEVRDLWPETLIDMGISKWHPFILLLGFLEKFSYEKADKIITTLPKAYKYIEALGISSDKIVWISNGTDIKNSKINKLKKLDNTKFNVVYTGTLGIANNLDVLIDVAEHLKQKENIYFTLIGDGPLKKHLIEKAKLLKLKNISFLPSVCKDEIFNYLACADLLYVGLKDLPLYKYGMSMNKIFDYMSVKKPILFISNMDDNIIGISKAGKVIKQDDKLTISDTIKDFSTMSQEELNKYGENGFKYLQQNFSIEVLVDKLEDVLEEIQKG